MTIEVVYSSDKFSPIKKGHSNPFDTYEFNITNPFDRGEIVGGFGYVEYDDSAKNTLYCLNMKEINKRKPKYAAAEFWGGTKKDYKTNQDVEIEGWKDEMVYKTMVRHVYGKIALDPQKVDDAFRHIQQREADYRDMELKNEISANANKEPINITPDKPVEKPKEVVSDIPHVEPKPPVQQQEYDQPAAVRIERQF